MMELKSETFTVRENYCGWMIVEKERKAETVAERTTCASD